MKFMWPREKFVANYLRSVGWYLVDIRSERKPGLPFFAAIFSQAFKATRGVLKGDTI